MKFGLPDTLLQKLQALFEHYPAIEEVIIYGSRAKGTYREGSDIDLALKGKHLSDELCKELWLAIDDLNSPYKVDICCYDSLPADATLRAHIHHVGQPLYVAMSAQE